MNITQLIQFGKEQLQENSKTALIDSKTLLGFFLQYSPSELIIHDQEEVSQNIQNKFLDAIEKRKKHIPLAYITNEKEFFGRIFFVNEQVLIPRPETEEVVEQVLKTIARLSTIDYRPLTILDLGTGSGCIAITLKKELPNAEVFAGDISEKALEIAKKNAQKLGADIHFFQTDLLKSLPAQFSVLSSQFSVLIANLPYVHENERHSSIQHEPELALFSGTDGLNHYRALAFQLQAKPICKILFLEIDDRQAEEIKNIFSFAKRVEIIKDIAGKQRIAKIDF